MDEQRIAQRHSGAFSERGARGASAAHGRAVIEAARSNGKTAT